MGNRINIFFRPYGTQTPEAWNHYDGESVREMDPQTSQNVDGYVVVPGKTALNNLGGMFGTVVTAVLPDKTFLNVDQAITEGGLSDILVGAAKGLLEDGADILIAPFHLLKDTGEAAFWAIVAGANIIVGALSSPVPEQVDSAVTALLPPEFSEVHIRDKTMDRTGYFHYALKDGKIWTRWDPIIPNESFRIDCGEIFTRKEAASMLTNISGPYTYTYDAGANQIVVTPKPEAHTSGYTMVAGRLKETELQKASTWHLHDTMGGPNLPAGEFIVQMQVSGEFIQAVSNKNKVYSYDPTKEYPVGWRQAKGTPMGNDLHLPDATQGWAFGLSMAVKPERVPLHSTNPWTDIVGYATDALGNRGAFGYVGTTGVLVEDKMIYTDTGLPADYERGFALPDKGQFKGREPVQAGSTWLVYGYNKDGLPSLYARMYDHELSGACAGMEPPTAEVKPFELGRVYTLDDYKPYLYRPSWVHIPFPTLTGNATITDHFDIRTTGQGNDAREIRIEGTSAAGASGYYSKKITEPEWIFVPTHEPVVGQRIVVGTVSPENMPKRVALDYPKGTAGGLLKDAPISNIELLDLHPFQTQGEPSTIRFTLTSGETIDVEIHTAEAWWLFQGRLEDAGKKGSGLGVAHPVLGTLVVPDRSFSPAVKAFIDKYLAPIDGVPNVLAGQVDVEGVHFETLGHIRKSRKGFDYEDAPKFEMSFTRDARGETEYEKMAADLSLVPSAGMPTSQLMQIIADNEALQAQMTKGVESRQFDYFWRAVRSKLTGAAIAVGGFYLNLVNRTETEDYMANVTDYGARLPQLYTDINWNAAWTTPPGYERAQETLTANLAKARGLLEIIDKNP